MTLVVALLLAVGTAHFVPGQSPTDVAHVKDITPQALAAALDDPDDRWVVQQLASIPVREFRALFDQVQHRPFGHLSGGIDRRGQSFLTIYFGLQPVLGDHGAVGDATELE